MPLNIPEKFRVGLAQLAAITDDQFNEVEQALGSSAAEIKTDDFPLLVAKKVKTLPEADTARIVDAVLPLYILLNQANTPVKDIIEDVFQNLQKLSEENKNTPVVKKEIFLSRLLKLISIPAIKVVTKAIDLIMQHQFVYEDARVFTDIRPLFDDDIKNNPLAAVIVHALHLQYRKSGESGEIFMALDHEDVEKLIKVLQRALEKENTIRQFLAASKMPHIET